MRPPCLSLHSKPHRSAPPHMGSKSLVAAVPAPSPRASPVVPYLRPQPAGAPLPGRYLISVSAHTRKRHCSTYLLPGRLHPGLGTRVSRSHPAPPHGSGRLLACLTAKRSPPYASPIFQPAAATRKGGLCQSWFVGLYRIVRWTAELRYSAAILQLGKLRPRYY
ncbi:hypothetical protein NDU88_001883 [Pleurodeles waltl]|uniref:Uncharacterized protein n=1 Tax=Pleurodeles waltl TaxID=8319 RepID=A0AAV7SA10_PLEWA|nr:hypothetical protein NDU88_001883 [Pleurodeles waltl]